MYRLLSLFLIIALFVSSCTTESDRPNPLSPPAGSSRFEQVSDVLGDGTSLILHRASTDPNVAVGDFLSRIWYYYGKPASIGFEGFSYTFRDRQTGLLFTAYAAGSGPAYGGEERLREKLLPVMKDFDHLLNEGRNADCSIEFQTDFGLLRAGARGGAPFEEQTGN